MVLLKISQRCEYLDKFLQIWSIFTLVICLSYLLRSFHGVINIGLIDIFVFNISHNQQHTFLIFKIIVNNMLKTLKKMFTITPLASGSRRS
jgi:hypothetical protein